LRSESGTDSAAKGPEGLGIGERRTLSEGDGIASGNERLEEDFLKIPLIAGAVELPEEESSSEPARML
jgi:hypothetical protein